MLEGQVLLEDVERAMFSLKTGVAPGQDGFCPDLLAVYREAIGQRLLPPSAKVEHITLLHKNGDMTDLANWRPTPLLMAGKILAKLLVLRRRKLMAQVVHPDQTCGVPGRMCSMKLALITDALAWAEQRRVPLALLSLDQEKAFERVSHEFLFMLLERMGFGPDVIDCYMQGREVT